MKYESRWFDTSTRTIVGHDSVGSEVGGTHYYTAAWFISELPYVGYEVVIEDEVVEDWKDPRFDY